MFVYHTTKQSNVASILRVGALVNIGWGLTKEGKWADEFYGGIRPIYVTIEAVRPVYAIGFGGMLRIDARGLELVADLPSLIDLGGSINFDAGTVWFESNVPDNLASFLDEDDEIAFADLIVPGPAASAAIRDTGTAAILADIPADRVQDASPSLVGTLPD